jgi:hypothetical protein
MQPGGGAPRQMDLRTFAVLGANREVSGYTFSITPYLKEESEPRAPG